MAPPPARPNAPTTRPITLIVRVIPGAARDGRFAGQVEVVDTGETLALSSIAEFVELLARLASDGAA